MKNNLKNYVKGFIYCITVTILSIYFSGCSAGQNGLLQITPQQYFYSAKEQLETVDERDYEVRDLDEIIRVLENAEKDARKSEIIDKSRLYLCLAHTLKAGKQYQNALMKGEYVANRAAPFYIVNTKDVKETLRNAKKWLRKCRSDFKTSSLIPDLHYVRGMYYLQKMLTQHAREKKDSLKISIESLRRCMGMAPDFEADFRLFGRIQTRREVRLKLIEALAFANQQTQAYALLSDYNFAPISPVSGATSYQDFAWHHKHGFVLATMGKLEKAAEVLNKFKIVAPQDYANVDEALWILEGVYDKLFQLNKEPRWKMEARIVAALQNKLKGPFSKEKYSTSAHLFPRTLPGDEKLFSAVIDFYKGDFEAALKNLNEIRKRGIMSSHNRISSQLLRIEAMLYSGQQITDDLLEELLRLADSRYLTTLQREKVGFLLARYILNEDKNFSKRRLDHEGQTFVKSICNKPWVLTIEYQRGEVKKVKEPLRFRDPKDEQQRVEREPSALICELYANKPNDWVVSANLYLFEIPQLSLLGKGRTVGREKENQGWIFKDKQIDALRRGHQYLAVFEFDNSDSEKSIQGVLFKP